VFNSGKGSEPDIFVYGAPLFEFAEVTTLSCFAVVDVAPLSCERVAQKGGGVGSFSRREDGKEEVNIGRKGMWPLSDSYLSSSPIFLLYSMKKERQPVD
jgi:hypothetical protein